VGLAHRLPPSLGVNSSGTLGAVERSVATGRGVAGQEAMPPHQKFVWSSSSSSRSRRCRCWATGGPQNYTGRSLFKIFAKW